MSRSLFGKVKQKIVFCDIDFWIMLAMFVRGCYNISQYIHKELVFSWTPVVVYYICFSC